MVRSATLAAISAKKALFCASTTTSYNGRDRKTIALRYSWSASDNGEENGEGRNHNVQRARHIVGFVRFCDASVRGGGTPAGVDQVTRVDLHIQHVGSRRRPHRVELDNLLC